jgi:hypothetical protein
VSALPRIEGYSFGQLVVDGEEQTRDVIVLPDRVLSNWWREEGHRLVLADLEDVLEELPEHLVVGTGAYEQMRPDPETVEQLREASRSRCSRPPKPSGATASSTRAGRRLRSTSPADSYYARPRRQRREEATVATTSKAASRSFDQPDEQAEKGGVAIDVVYLGDLKVKRAKYPPGWKFSRDMGADRCGDTHVGYTIEGSLRTVMDDGTELDIKTGDVFKIPGGHDAWTEEGCTIVQFDEFDSAARRFGTE